MSSISNHKNNNNINKNSYLNRILLPNKCSNYNLEKKSKEKLINANLEINKLNNSSINNNNNITFQKYKKEINNKTKRENISVNKKKENKNVCNKNNSFLSNNNDKYLRNNYHKKDLNNSLNNFSKTSFDFFKKRFSQNNNNNIFNNSNKSRLKSFDGFNKNNKKCNSNNDLNHSRINIKNNSKKRTKTPTIEKNNSKYKLRPISNNNSKEKNINIDNIYKKKVSHSGTNLNVNKVIKKNYNLKTNIKKKFFQANNIFAQFKPKKKNKTIMHQEELIMKKNYLFLNNDKLNNKNKENEQSNENKGYKSDESNQKLKDVELKKEISPLTNSTAKINILKCNKNNSQSNNYIKSFSNINNSQLKHNMNINDNDSNTQLQYLNVNSAISLSTNINTNTNTINNINSLINIKENKENSSLNVSKQGQKQVFQGKKIKCIHEISKTGISGVEKKINQDRNFIFRNFVEGFENIFMGVCDGHGYFGNEISEYIKENLPMDLNRLIKCRKLDIYNEDLSEVLIDTFLMENNALLRNKQIDSDLSGSTCISVIYTPKKLIISNVGDSRCVLGSRVEGVWEYKNLSRDHKPTIKEEADRIKKNGGRIRPMIDEDGCFVGPLRVYMKDKDLPGLAMTRSFGDYFASLAGTIAEPEIKEHILVPEDKFIILASDGLFEFISSEEVGNIIKEYYEKNDIVECCEYLYKESYRKWVLEEEDTVDDITIILVFFED